MLSAGLGSPTRRRSSVQGSVAASSMRSSSSVGSFGLATSTAGSTARGQALNVRAPSSSIFSVEYRGCIAINESFPQPGAMQPEHFTRLAEGIEGAVLSQTKRQVKKAAKKWRKSRLSFDTRNGVITVIDASSAAPIAILPLLELLSFRVLRTLRTAGFTDALLFAKHPTADRLVAHRVLFDTTADITAFHATLKAEFNAVSEAADRATANTSANTNTNTNGGDTVDELDDDGNFAITIRFDPAGATRHAQPGNGTAATTGGNDGTTARPANGGRRRYLFCDDSDELVIADAVGHDDGSDDAASSMDDASTIKTLSSTGDSDVVEAEC